MRLLSRSVYILAIVVGSSALAQQPAIRMSLAQPVEAELDFELSEDEISELKASYDELAPDEQAQMKAFYLDMGIDLDALFGAADGDAATGEEADEAPAQTLLQAVQKLDFARTPQSVLAARARLGLEQSELPDAEAPGIDSAQWLHQHVLAGEWEAFGTFMRDRAGDDAEAIYSHVLQSTNQGEPAILPEEVLAISDAAPAALTDWQLDILSQLLKTAAKTSSTGPLIARIRAGTAMFGSDEPKRARTATFLARAGMPIDAYEYLPPIDQARDEQDARVMLDHAAYHTARARVLRGDDAARANTTAWRICCDAALLSDAEFELRQEAMRSAIDMLPEIPPAVGTEWLTRVFESESLAPVALEVIALKGMQAQDAQAMLTMKEAVETLLENPEVDPKVLRVPLRMLTIGLVNQAESAIKEYDAALAKGRGINTGIRRKTELLLRALPDERWFDAIEPSLATRAYTACINIALAADEPDVALDFLEAGAVRARDDSETLAEAFLARWSKQLKPAASPAMNQYYFFGPGMRSPSAPLTRGRQRRNLDRLTRLVATLDGIGIDARRFGGIVDAFKACHGDSEAFRRDEIIRILGPIEGLAPNVSASIAGTMRASLNGDWRNRQVHQQAGMRRSAPEIAIIVEQGYNLAVELIDAAAAHEPDSWQHAMLRAALAYDRLQYTNQQREQEFATFNEHRRQAFESFADAASQYGRALADGRERASSNVYQVWFNAALGSSELNYLTRDDMLLEGSNQDDQIDRIRDSILALPRDAADEHIGEFARSVVTGLGGLDPEVKPRVVRHAVRVIGQHPAGAPLRRLGELYEDLVKDEVKLRLTLDGSANVGDRPFGAVLTLRYTNAVDRETNGFAQYLQNNVWTMRRNRGTIVNYRDRLQESIETAIGDAFDLDAIGFFESMNPPRSIKEEGEDGWLEKPVAYLVLTANDPSADHIPPVQMDLSFTDTAGPVTLPVISNTPLIDAAASADGRPMFDVAINQTIDLRAMDDADEGRKITLEISATGRGLVPDLDALLTELDDALPGYRVKEDGVEARPVNAVMQDQLAERGFWGYDEEEMAKHEYAEADDDGIFRVTTERSWLITYEPTGAGVGEDFQLPALADGVDAKLTSLEYADADIVPVTARSIPVSGRAGRFGKLMIAAMGLVLLGGIALVIMIARRQNAANDRDASGDVPDDLSPLGAISMLQRLEPGLQPQQAESLRADIQTIQAGYFGPTASETGPDVVATVRRWVQAAR